MNAIDTDFLSAFAGRVRQQLADNTRKGDPTMNTTAEPATSTVPATFQPDPDAPCEAFAWCVETGAHIDHMGRRVGLPTGEGAPVLEAHLYADEDGLTLDYDGGHDDWQELASGDELRAEVAKVRAHLVRLEALADEYDAIREAAPAAPAPAPRRFTLRTTDGRTVTAHLPQWAEHDPSEDGIDPEELHDALDCVAHRRYYPGQPVHAEVSGQHSGGTHPILVPQIEVDPFDERPDHRVPTVAVELIAGGDDWIAGLDPAGVVELAGKLRAQADVLDQVAADLIAARVDWDANGGAR